MGNPFKPPKTGPNKGQTIDESTYRVPPVPRIPRLSDQDAYYRMSRGHHQAPDPLPYEIQPPPAQQNYAQNPFGDQPDPSFGQTDQPPSFPRYSDLDPFAPFRFGDQEDPDPQDAVAGPADPSLEHFEPLDFFDLNQQEFHHQASEASPSVPYEAVGDNRPNQQQAQSVPLPPFQHPFEVAAPEPRFIRAAQVGPGQYMAKDVRGNSQPIQAKEQDNPFAEATRRKLDGGGGKQGQGRGGDAGDPMDRGFLKSNITPHDKYCSLLTESSGGDDKDCEDCEDDKEDEEDEEEPCRRNASKSPSVLKKRRDDNVLAKRIAQLEGEIANLEGSHQGEIAYLKRRAVEAVGEAASLICGIQRGSHLWNRVVQDVQEKMEGTAKTEDESEED